jgi:hypothetical protein
MNRWILLATLAGAGLSMGGQEWTSKSLEKALPDGEKGEDESVSLRGKVVERDDKDDDGNAITRAFLEQDDGGLIPLPCERKNGDKPGKNDKGLAAKTAGKATAGIRGAEPSCWDYLGDKVEILGTVQSIHKKTKHIRRLAKITDINPLG